MYHVAKNKTLISDCSASLLPALPDFYARALVLSYFRKSNPKRKKPKSSMIAIIRSHLALFLAHFAPFLMSHNIHSATYYQYILILSHKINAIYPHTRRLWAYHMLYYVHITGVWSHFMMKVGVLPHDNPPSDNPPSQKNFII